MKKASIALYWSRRLLLGLLGIAQAQTGGGYDLSWQTIDGGGGTSSGGGYSLAGTIGQADAGLLSGGQYTLRGGFWSGAGYLRQVYLPLVRRGL